MFTSKIFIMFLTCLLQINYSNSMEEQRIVRNEYWLSPLIKINEILWPRQSCHQLTAYDYPDEPKEPVACIQCIMPRFTTSGDVLLEIQSGCFNSKKSEQYQQTRKHVLTTFSYLLARGYTILKFSQKTFEKIKQLEINDYKLILPSKGTDKSSTSDDNTKQPIRVTLDY